MVCAGLRVKLGADSESGEWLSLGAEPVRVMEPPPTLRSDGEGSRYLSVWRGSSKD